MNCVVEAMTFNILMEKPDNSPKGVSRDTSAHCVWPSSFLFHQHCIKKCHIFARYVLAIQKCLQINFFLSQACNSSISFPGFSRYGAQVYRCPGQFPLPFKQFNVAQASLLLYLLPIMTLTYSFRILGFKSSLPEAVKVLSK